MILAQNMFYSTRSRTASGTHHKLLESAVSMQSLPASEHSMVDGPDDGEAVRARMPCPPQCDRPTVEPPAPLPPPPPTDS
jgi:hypothetical protein